MKRLRFSHLVSIFLVAVALLAAGCSQKPAPAPKKYEIDGKILKLDAQQSSATIKHKDIAGLMKGMTMEFAVRGKGEFAKLHEGDHIIGALYTTDDDLWVSDIKVMPPTPEDQPKQ